jgi:hypothetical protein
MIEPTIGRIVWIYGRGCDEGDEPTQPTDKPEAAMIADCWQQKGTGRWHLNVGGLDHEGRFFTETHVPLVQEFTRPATNDRPFATWMPFQKGQAAKTEALEKQLGSGGWEASLPAEK